MIPGLDQLDELFGQIKKAIKKDRTSRLDQPDLIVCSKSVAQYLGLVLSKPEGGVQ